MGMVDFDSRMSESLSFQNENYAIKVGYIVGVHYPTDEGYTNLGTKDILYDVSAYVIGPNGMAPVVFKNLRWGGGMFGNPNEYSRVSLLSPKNWNDGDEFTEDLAKQTSYVVFACDNGRSQNGYILGLAEHPLLKADSKELGHYWEQAFNGVSCNINKDGEYSVTFTGAILDSETNLFIEAPEETTGTTIKLDKEGSLILDNVKGESLKLDKKAKLIDVKAREMKVDVTEKDYKTTVKGKTVFLSEGNAVFNGKKIYIGKEGSTEPLVLGNKLASALGMLIRQFLWSVPLGMAGNIPVFPSPALRNNLVGWLNMYGVQNTSPFLSRKSFVE